VGGNAYGTFVVSHHRITPSRGRVELSKVDGCVASEARAGLVAGVAIERARIADKGAGIAEETNWTVDVAEVVFSQIEAGEAALAESEILAGGTA
jgi:hypothetical protein